MADAPEHRYLGTRLTPREYYRRMAHAYHNPHAEGIAILLDAFAEQFHGTVLDLGCGDGLATKLLAGRDLAFVGVDDAPRMVARYERETGFPGQVASFEAPLPPADSAVASYAMHLATAEQATLMWYRLWEAGVDRLVVITPFKERPADPAYYFQLAEHRSGPYGPDGKTIHGKLYTRRD